MKIFVLVLTIALPTAYPQSSPPDFLDILTNKVMNIKFKGDVDKVNSLLSSELLSCIPIEQRNAMKTCEDKLKDMPHMPPMVAECILVDLVKALNNVTRLLDVKAFQVSVIEPSSVSLSADQKKSASAGLELCIESDFALPPPPFIERDGKPVEFVPKYDNRNSPLRAMVCLVKVLIENGCSNVKIEKRSLTGQVNEIETDNASGEK